MKTRSMIVRRLCYALMLVLLGPTVFGQEPATKVDDKLRLDTEELKRWTAFYQREATEYDIFLDASPGSDRREKLKLRDEPVFRWAAPEVNNEFNGVVFVWTRDGRPEAVGSIWSKSTEEVLGQRTICHSFHSLALGPLHADRMGEPWWYPEQAGIEPQLIPASPVPAKSARSRLTQMRALAREFTASQFADRAGTKLENLRLLPRPIYRHDGESDQSPDVGIFVFLRDWDPEVLLLIETRKTPAGRRWHYAPIRFCSVTAVVKHNDKEVWTYKQGGPTRDPQHFYFTAKGASYVNRYFGSVKDEKP